MQKWQDRELLTTVLHSMLDQREIQPNLVKRDLDIRDYYGKPKHNVGSLRSIEKNLQKCYLHISEPMTNLDIRENFDSTLSSLISRFDCISY